jgi:hypothetical protein
MTFTDYAKNKGCALLKDDMAYLLRLLGHLSKPERSKILRKYIDVWVDAMAHCDDENKRQNQGRFAANTWVRLKDD